MKPLYTIKLKLTGATMTIWAGYDQAIAERELQKLFAQGHFDAKILIS